MRARWLVLVVVMLAACNRKHGDAYKMEQVAASGSHACAVMKDGAVRCWGRDHDKGVLAPTLQPTVHEASVNCVGPSFDCVERRDGTVSCTGIDVSGLESIHDAKGVACGEHHVCVSTKSGVVCANAGQPLKLVPGAAGAASIAAGGGTTCATFTDGTAKCWGRGKAGQLGNGHFEDRDEPDLVGALDVRSIAVGAEHTCAVLRNETVVCFGANADGQLGDGETTPSAAPRAVVGINIAWEVSCGAHHTCARMGDSTVHCWGRNDVHQASITNESPVLKAKLLTGLYEADHVTAGDDFTCVQMKDGWLRCFGVNDWGQLADGTNEIRNVPTPIRY